MREFRRGSSLTCRLPEALTLYRAGLGVLEGLARQAGASSFHALGGPEREQILSSLAGGPDGPGVWRGVPVRADAMSSRSTGLRGGAARWSAILLRCPATRLADPPSEHRSPQQ